MKARYLYIFEATLTIIVALGLLIFDMILDLGDFSGLVFYLYFTYYLVLVGIINLLFTIVRFFQKKDYKKYLICLGSSLLCLFILFLVATLTS